MEGFTARAGNVKAALASGAVTFTLYVLIHRALDKPIDWREARLWALGAAASMYFVGI